MARPAKPLNVHILKGTGKKHPERMRERENEPENINPIGDAPETLSKIEQAAWHEIVNNAIPGVLGEADRLAVEETARLVVKCRGLGDEPAIGQERNLLNRYLGQMGMTPSERSKIRIDKPKPKNKFDE